MPPTKKPAARTSRRSSATLSATSPISRKEVEAAAARFEKSLDEASQALQAMGSDLGRAGKTAYREIEKALKALRRDATKTNRNLLKDFDRLRAAVTPSKPSSRTTAAKTPAKTTAKPAAKTTAKTTAKATASKTPARSAGKSTAAKAPARSSRKTVQ